MTLFEIIEAKILEEYGTLGLEAYRKFLANGTNNKIIKLIDEMIDTEGNSKDLVRFGKKRALEQLKQKIEAL